MRRLKPGKAAGSDNITPELLKEGGRGIIFWLTYLFYCIWTTAHIPSDWLLGIILPFWKGKGTQENCSNYRGITLLSIPSKVFAHVLLARIRPLILKKQRKQHSGFSPGRSTVDRILALRLLAEKRREFRRPLYAAYVMLRI